MDSSCDVTGGFADLVRQFDSMVETVAMSSAMSDADIRRVLRFVSQVIQVVEQAFQEVLTLLIEVKYLDATDLNSPRLREMRKQVELLTARSFYRDAAEICSRLKHLCQTFDESIRPSLSKLPELAGWQGVLGLIEDREGRIIRLIESTAEELESLLSSIAPGGLERVSAMASINAERLRGLLSELHELNGRILGYSGRAGFLELTRDRQRLEREIQIMVDKRDQSVVHGHRISMGDNNSVAQLVASESIQGSFNTIERSVQSHDLKQALKLLCTQVQELLKSMPLEKQRDVEQDLDNLVNEAAKESPRRKWYELSASGLVEAATACAGAASPVIATVKAVLGLLPATP